MEKQVAIFNEVYKRGPTRPSVDENVLREFASILPFRDKGTLTIIDAGGGEGSNLKLFSKILNKHSKRVPLLVCLDLSMEGLRRCKQKGIQAVRGSLTHLPFQNSSFNVGFCIHVLEHIADDQKAIAELARIIKDEGVIYLSAPNKPTNMHPPFILSSRIIDYTSSHVRSGYDVMWIRKEFEKRGFTVLVVGYYGFIGYFLKYLISSLIFLPFFFMNKILHINWKMQNPALERKVNKFVRKIGDKLYRFDNHFSRENPRGHAFFVFLKNIV